MKKIKQELRIWIWRLRYWLSLPLWWLIEPRAETLCENYTRGLVDQDDYDCEVRAIQNDMQRIEGDLTGLDNRVADVEGALE